MTIFYFSLPFIWNSKSTNFVISTHFWQFVLLYKFIRTYVHNFEAFCIEHNLNRKNWVFFRCESQTYTHTQRFIFGSLIFNCSCCGISLFANLLLFLCHWTYFCDNSRSASASVWLCALFFHSYVFRFWLTSID